MDKRNQTSLHYAAWLKPDIKIVTALLKAGANPNVADKYGNTSLHYITLPNILFQYLQSSSPPNIKAVTALLKAGADPNAVNGYGDTPLHFVALQSSSPENAKAVTALLKAGADPNAVDRYGYTPLDDALSSRHPKTAIVTALLKSGAEVGANQNTADTSSEPSSRPPIRSIKTRCRNSFK